MRLPKLITAAWLLKKGACKRQVMRFQKRWPDGAEITAENVKKAQWLGLDLYWFIYTNLPKRVINAWDDEALALDKRHMAGELTLEGSMRLLRRLHRDTILRAGGKVQP